MGKSNSMLKYIIKRLLYLIPMMFLVIILTWIMSRLMAGDPVLLMYPIGTPEATLEAKRIEMGLYDPWYIQLGRYLSDLLHGNFGKSYVVAPNVNVIDYIKKVWPRTLELVLLPIIIVPVISIKMGVKSATDRGKVSDFLIRGFAVAGVAIPSYWFAMMLQLLFGYYLPNFTDNKISLPIFGFKSQGFEDPPFVTGFRIIDCILANDQILLFDTITHMILPTIAIIFLSLSGITRVTRSSMLDILEQDYIRTARAKGCSKNMVINKHALRNAMIPTSTMIVYSIAASLTGSFFIETVFNYNGIGRVLLLSIQYQDYWLLNGVVLFIGTIMVLANLVADIVYTIIDPRIKY